MDFDFLNWSNFFALCLVVGGFVGTMIGAKYKNVMDQLGELGKALQKGYDADGPGGSSLTKAEKQEIFKEVLDVLKSILAMKWNIFKFFKK
jgi:hypothetical protein